MGLLARAVLGAARSGHPALQRGVDRLVTQLLRMRYRPLFQDHGPCPDLGRQLAACVVPQVRVGDGEQELSVATVVGRLSVGLRTLHAADATRPLLVYHHGAGEIPVDRGLRLAAAPGPLGMGLVVVRSAGHRSLADFKQTYRSGNAALAAMVASVATIEAVCRAHAPRPVVVLGVSLGGMVATCHAARFAAERAAAGQDIRWAPVVAGPDFTHVLTRGNFARLRDGSVAPAVVAQRFAGALRGLPADRVHPLMGIWDQLHTPGVQIPAWRRLGVAPTLLARGHIGAALDGAALRRHCLIVASRLRRP